MSVVRRPAIRGYWERFLQYERKASIMTSQRIKRIQRFFHCNDNENIYTDFPDKIFKIHSLIDALKERFHLLVPTQLLCIDEQMVPFKVDRRSNNTVCICQRNGAASFMSWQVLCPDGLVYNFEVHTGTIDMCSVQPDLQASGNIVMKLLANIPRHKGHKLFIDNWYTSVPLATTLMNQRMALVGTDRANRLRNYIMPSDKDMKKEGRGTIAINTS